MASLGEITFDVKANTKGLDDALRKVQQLNKELQGAAGSAGNFQQAQKTVRQSVQSTTKTTKQAQNQLLSLKSSLGGAERASAQYTKAQQKLKSAQEAGLVSQKEVARLQGQINERFSTAATRARSVGSAMKKLKGAVTAVQSAFVALAAAMAVKELAQFASGAVDAAAKLDKLSSRTGVSAEKIQAFQKAAQQAGVSGDKAAEAVGELNLKVGEARSEGGEAAEAFKRLGVDLKDASGNAKSTQQVFNQTVNKIAAIEDPTRQAAAAAKVFGEEAGPQLVNAIDKGTQGLDKYQKQLKASGSLITSEVAAKADKAQKAIGNFGDRIAKSLQVGTLEGFTSQFGKLSEQLNDPQTIKAFNQIGRAIGFIAAKVIEGIKQIPKIVKAISNFKEQAVAAFTAVRERVASFLQFFGTLPEKMTNIAKKTVQGVKEWFVGGFTSVVDGVRDKMNSVTNAFSSAYQSIVGGSIVPDLVRDVGREMDGLDDQMVKPAQRATEQVAQAFEENLGDLIGRVIRGQGAQFGQFISNIADTAITQLSNVAAKAIKIGRAHV